MRYLCTIHEIDETWKITGTKEVDEDFFVGENLYIEVTKDQYKQVVSLLLENELTYAKKDMPFNMDKMAASKLDPLDVAKYSTKSVIMNSIRLKFSELDQYSILKFMMLNIELSDKGHYLHSGNLDEKIKEIKESNNPKLLKKTIEIAEIIRSLEPKLELFNKMSSLRKDIDLSISIDQIKEKIKLAELG